MHQVEVQFPSEPFVHRDGFDLERNRPITQVVRPDRHSVPGNIAPRANHDREQRRS